MAEEQIILIPKDCPSRGCTKSHDGIEVKASDYDKWLSGAFVQSAFPYLTVGQREMFISGYHPECFDRDFPET